jgi:hypothetical protein
MNRKIESLMDLDFMKEFHEAVDKSIHELPDEMFGFMKGKMNEMMTTMFSAERFVVSIVMDTRDAAPNCCRVTPWQPNVRSAVFKVDKRTDARGSASAAQSLAMGLASLRSSMPSRLKSSPKSRVDARSRCK